MPTFVYSGLAHAAFPGTGHPDALVHVPAAFDAQRFGLLIYLHGFDNCIENAAAPPPGIHDPPHPTADLITQLEDSGKSVLLFLPETKYHEQSRDPGALGQEGGLLRLLTEVLGKLGQDWPAAADLGPSAMPRMHRVMLCSHSGAYRAAIRMAQHGGIAIDELCLLDSLYKDVEEYQALLVQRVAQQKAGAALRFVNLYRAGGTAAHSVAQGELLRALLSQHDLPEDSLCFDDHESEPSDEELAHPWVIKRVPTAHSDFGRTYIGRLLRTSRL
ncbi:MAG: hypothetical protein JNJ46_02470 [Myxococcales bacterium]|nr:hypothetical protein [Myxococcales bacterium]